MITNLVTDLICAEYKKALSVHADKVTIRLRKPQADKQYNNLDGITVPHLKIPLS